MPTRATVGPAARMTRPFGTLGSPRQHPTLGDVNEARVTEEGELELRNPAVMRGYWRMPEETERVLSRDGWLKTGDLVRENGDGTYTFLERSPDVLDERHDRLRPGINHLAFTVADLQALDALRAAGAAHVFTRMDALPGLLARAGRVTPPGAAPRPAGAP